MHAAQKSLEDRRSAVVSAATLLLQVLITTGGPSFTYFLHFSVQFFPTITHDRYANSESVETRICGSDPYEE